MQHTVVKGSSKEEEKRKDNRREGTRCEKRTELEKRVVRGREEEEKEKKEYNRGVKVAKILHAGLWLKDQQSQYVC